MSEPITPRTKAGRRVLTKYGTFTPEQRADLVYEVPRIEAEVLEGVAERVRALPGKWVAERAYPGDHHGVDWLDRDAVLALFSTDRETT